MCTAITYKGANHYFGRNLDLEYSYNETVTVTPRNFPLKFRCFSEMTSHYAIIGTAIIEDSYPLYYDASNEKGLSAAGLNFPGNAAYMPFDGAMQNITPFEFIPWILGQCSTVSEAKSLLNNVNLVDINFNKKFPLTPLHWIIADKNSAITVEAVGDGVKIYDNPVGVLTNNPTFDIQLFNLNNYISLSSENPENTFSDKIPLTLYSRGMGGLGLPGDLSSSSRFVRAAFTKLNAAAESTEKASVGQFFHILSTVAHTKGCVKVGEKYEITVYSSCCNTDKGIYYYTTYENQAIMAVDMHKENLDANVLISYPFIKEQKITMQNEKNM